MGCYEIHLFCFSNVFQSYSFAVLQRKRYSLQQRGRLVLLVSHSSSCECANSSFQLSALGTTLKFYISKYITNKYRNVPGKSLAAFKMLPDLIHLARLFPKG